MACKVFYVTEICFLKLFLRKNACKIKLLWYIKATLKGDLCLYLRANLVF